MELWKCTGFRGSRGTVLTQGPGGCNLAEGSIAHFIAGQDAEMIVSVRGQACHLQPSASGGGHRHRKPVLLRIIITRRNLLHPAERDRQREEVRTKERRETLGVWFYET